MKVVVYNIKSFEKEFLAKANQKKHDITLISNPLTIETASYAQGKNAVVVSINDDVSAKVINKLAGLGVKYIATRSLEMGHIDRLAAAANGIMLANVPATSPYDTADQTIKTLDLWQSKKCVGDACICSNKCNEAEINTFPPTK
ncbi:lactate dehydrogenase [Mucilaginibacter sp. AW1-3]